MRRLPVILGAMRMIPPSTEFSTAKPPLPSLQTLFHFSAIPIRRSNTLRPSCVHPTLFSRTKVKSNTSYFLVSSIASNLPSLAHTKEYLTRSLARSRGSPTTPTAPLASARCTSQQSSYRRRLLRFENPQSMVIAPSIAELRQ